MTFIWIYARRRPFYSSESNVPPIFPHFPPAPALGNERTWIPTVYRTVVFVYIHIVCCTDTCCLLYCTVCLLYFTVPYMYSPTPHRVSRPYTNHVSSDAPHADYSHAADMRSQSCVQPREPDTPLRCFSPNYNLQSDMHSSRAYVQTYKRTESPTGSYHCSQWPMGLIMTVCCLTMVATVVWWVHRCSRKLNET